MQLGSDTRIPDGLLAAITLLREKPHQGVPSSNPAPHQGIDEHNSTAALGLRASAALNRVWPRYTGKERDTESGNDYFGARYYNSNVGRLMSPDPIVISPELGNPQSWNKYSYSFNNPLGAVDPDGAWPYYIHNEIDEAVFGGVLSSHDISVIEKESYLMDFGDSGHQQDPSRANEHGMCQPGQGSDACWQGIASWVDTAFGNSQSSSGDASLQYLADALHTVQDLGSPEHVGPGGPKTWGGGRIEGLVHIFGESSPEEGWAGIGTSIRNSVNLYALAHPDVAKKQGGADRWTENSINSYVDDYFSRKADAPSNGMPGSGHEAGKEEAARQCALGNPAACDN